jgi:hypothetical protein
MTIMLSAMVRRNCQDGFELAFDRVILDKRKLALVRVVQHWKARLRQRKETNTLHSW